MIPSLRLDGRRALVTGARRGIGRAIAAMFVEAGASVAISHEGEHDAFEARETGRVIGTAAVIAADLSDPAAPARLMQDATRCLGGPIGILVCNAAVDRRIVMADLAVEDIDLTFAVNVRSTLELVRAALPGLRALEGRLILLGSVQQWRPNPNQIAYAASKAAIANMGRNLARQLAPEGITVNVLCPGAIETEGNATALADPEYRRIVEARIPNGRLGRPEDVAAAALFLCSRAASYVNGTEILIDGALAAG